MKDILQWIEDTIPEEIRASIETKIQANAAMTNPLIKQLVALRAQLKENAYQKIFEARASVADDLLKLTQSLTNLIHFSSVAGEDTSAYVALLRSVSKVTQQLTFFGEDDANGDGVKDEEETVIDDDLSLSLDDGSSKPLTIDEAKNPAIKQQQSQSPKQAPVNKDTGKTAEQEIDEAANDPTEDEGEGEEEPAQEKPKSDSSLDDVLNSLNGKPSKEDSEDSEEPSNDESSEDESSEDAPEEAPSEDDAGTEESDEESDSSKKPVKKKSFLEELDEEPSEEDSDEDTESEDADAAVAAAVATAPKFDINKARFVYRGVIDGTINVIVNDIELSYKPESTLFGGDVNKLDIAMKKLMVKNHGYTAPLLKIQSLSKSKQITLIAKSRLKPANLHKELLNKVDKAQLGEVTPKPGTPWRWRGIGIHALSNQEECVWFEVGSKEYAALPNKKALKEDEDLEAFNNRIEAKLKTLSYNDGLKFVLGLVERKVLNTIYVGQIEK
jgi:hypothetical protein